MKWLVFAHPDPEKLERVFCVYRRNHKTKECKMLTGPTSLLPPSRPISLTQSKRGRPLHGFTGVEGI